MEPRSKTFSSKYLCAAAIAVQRVWALGGLDSTSPHYDEYWGIFLSTENVSKRYRITRVYQRPEIPEYPEVDIFSHSIHTKHIRHWAQNVNLMMVLEKCQGIPKDHYCLNHSLCMHMLHSTDYCCWFEMKNVQNPNTECGWKTVSAGGEGALLCVIKTFRRR